MKSARIRLADALPCPPEKTLAIAETPTGLKALDEPTQQRIINWGYAVCDAAMRSHVLNGAASPADFPYQSA